MRQYLSSPKFIKLPKGKMRESKNKKSERSESKTEIFQITLISLTSFLAILSFLGESYTSIFSYFLAETLKSTA